MPEAFDGGNIALVKDDDIIEVNVKTKTMQLFITEEEMAARRSAWQQPALKVNKGLLFKYARQVKDASLGCVTDEI
jgi:dihydroxy-acid dehydratase